ncbi:TRAM domain-containing protein, partial [Mycobacterium sp. 1274756.6]|uniref:TRAM domain-containing protein n=1 Tax=Mycobacterium sp. 1274756.6 TaxID=1834076 RepID=UPI0012E7405B
MSGAELTVRTDAPANGGRCVARHDGRVVFVRGALPGERVRVRVTEQRSAYWHAEVLEVLDAAAGRVASLCPIAGVDGAGCCDLAFADPSTARSVKAAVVANQLARYGRYDWAGEAEPLGTGAVLGWRTRVQLDVDPDGRPGFHRYRSDELVPDLRCGQLPAELTDGLDEARWPPGARLHAV